jgi:shikimate dehydrogenase
MTLSGNAKLAGVMGWPIAHSLSPRLHGYWLQEYGIDGAYLPLPVLPGNLEHALRALSKIGFRGVNLTVPHKEAAVPFLDDVDDVTRRIGAVNTVFVSSDGALSGTNTDARGFISNLKANAKHWSADDGPAVVLGAGGSARAVVVGLVDAGCNDIVLVNRTRKKADALAQHIGGPITLRDWSDRNDVLETAALLVNTTTLGMANQPALDVNLGTLPKDAVVTDIVYAPLETPLLAAAKTRGNIAVDGLGMLLHQAAPGFEGWFGQIPEVTSALRTYVLEAS